MGHAILILGLLLWSGAHLFKRLAPARRMAMGDAGRGLVAVLVLASVVLMVLGYRWADPVMLWSPPPFLRHVNNLLVLFAFYLYAASGLRTAVTARIRHPQLTAVKAWALGHLLVRGDLASVLLFGGLLAWAVVSVIAINRASPEWQRPVPAAGPAREAMALAGGVVVFGVVAMIHGWLGYYPFG